MCDGNVETKAKIANLDLDCIRSICTGQVIASLATAGKELIENALDAGATVIEVKAKDHGLDYLEVSDNGSGIKEENFGKLARPHCTSKLRDFADLNAIATFGFRGEALNALAALSQLTVVTRQSDSRVATRLEFDHGGKIVKQSSCARTVGTTVNVSRFFEPLIVRRKELEKNAKKEFAKLANLITAYCLISRSTRIEFVHLINGKRQTVVSTKCGGQSSLRSTICNVFGLKQLETLVELEKATPTDDDVDSIDINNCSKDSSLASAATFSIEGFVSAPKKESGRGNGERQYTYVNGRPCDYPRLCRLINEIYREFSQAHQYYAVVVLNVSTDEGSFDVNVTPDKRTVYLKDEKALFAIVKASLRRTYSKYAGQNSLTTSASKLVGSSSTLHLTEKTIPRPQCLKTSEIFEESSAAAPIAPKRQKRLAETSFFANNGERRSSFIEKPLNYRVSSAGQTTEMKTLDMPMDIRDSNENQRVELGTSLISSHAGNNHNDEESVLLTTNCCSRIIFNSQDRSLDNNGSTILSETGNYCTSGGNVEQDEAVITAEDSFTLTFHNKQQQHQQQKQLLLNKKPPSMEINLIDDNENLLTQSCSSPGRNGTAASAIGLGSRKFVTENLVGGVMRKVVSLNVSLESLSAHYKETFKAQTDRNEAAGESSNFRAKIIPNDNEAAEIELTRQITKDIFGSMEIIGQFNLGFIVVRWLDDLFIIDQHASDEKFTFELMSKCDTLRSQRLIRPVLLSDDLSFAELIVIQNGLTVFRKNGFDFEITTDAIGTEENCTIKVKLISVPAHYQQHKGRSNWKDDMNELISKLSDGPDFMHRPSSVRSLLASQACRKAIMIGTVLSVSQMRRIVRNMGQMDQPWNCPHGRPTMRHLFDLKPFI